MSRGLIIASIASTCLLAGAMLPARLEARTPSKGIWITRQEIMALPTSGPAWDALLAQANQPAGVPLVRDQNQLNNVYVLAKALVYVRTGIEGYRNEVVQNCLQAIDTELGGETLALGRELAAYVIAADLVELDEADDVVFRAWLRRTLTETLANRTLQSTHEVRPNNWGTLAGGSRAAVAVYLDDAQEIARTAQVFKGWLGDRSSYVGFKFGSPDAETWMPSPTQPRPVNPVGSTIQGHSVDGALPDDMRRGCAFQWPPCPTGYPWEGLSGAVTQAEILNRRGYDTWNWENQAIRRAVDYLASLDQQFGGWWTDQGDEQWVPWVVNRAYGTHYRTQVPARLGKNLAWTDWTHSFTIVQHTLDVSIVGSGSVSRVPDQPAYDGGTLVQLTATPAVGWTFTGWGGAVTGTTNPANLSMDGNKTVTATFAPVTFTLTYVAGAGGTITGTTPQTVAYGANGTLVTAVPDANHHFVGWSDAVPTATRTDLNVTGSISATASFALNAHTLTYTAGANGSISGATPQIIDHGSSGTPVTAVPDAGYVFVHWSDGVLTAERTELDVNADVAVSASFATNAYTLIYTAEVNGSITGSTPQVVGEGGDGAPVTAVPDVGYSFQRWNDGVLTATRAETNVSADVSVVASFVINTYTLTYSPEADGSISGTTLQTVDHGGAGTPVTAVPDADHQFVRWSDGVLTAARTETNVTADFSVTASFALNTYTLTYTPGVGGTIAGTTPQIVNHGADGLEVTAVPDVGYSFGGWSDGVLTAARTETNVTADVSETANFVVNTYTLTYAAGEYGSISGTTPQIVDHGSSGTMVTAVGNTGYQFVRWSDGVRTAARTETNVTGDVSVTASFAISTYTLTYLAGTGGAISGPTPQVVVEGESGTPVTAVPNVGHSFVGWTDGVLAAMRTETNVTAHLSVTATFVIDTYTLTYLVDAHGTILGITPQVVDYGSGGVQVTAVPETGYHFVSWSDGVLTAERIETNVTADVSVTAGFGLNTYTLTYAAGAGGTISGTTSQAVDHGASGTQVSALSDANYHFVSWSDGVPTVARTETNVTSDVSVSATFALDTYTLTYLAGLGGTISGATGQVVDYGGAGTPATAVPSTGYHFIDWSDGVLTASRIETNVTADISVTASFALNTYTLTYVAGAGGTISGITSQAIDHGSSGTPVTAVPDANYHFVSWSDGVLTASRTESNVAANVSVTATFTSSLPPTQATFTPSHDSRVISSTPTVTAGSATELRVRGSGQINYAFLKFNVTGISGAVTSAKLRLFCVNDSPDGGEVRLVSNSYLGTTTPWVESALNWNNAPANSGTPIAKTGTVANNVWVEFDVTSAITGNNSYSFGMASGSSNIAGYSSKEGANPPQLVIVAGSSPIPVVSSFVPVSGTPGTQITIAGLRFTGTTAVAFNGVAATFTVDSDTQIRATVPAAATTGPITVTNGAGPGTSSTSFTVIGPPVIAGFTPSSGPLGTLVTINGTGFTSATEVTFNGQAATFIIDGNTQLRATVPATATTGVIAMTNAAGTTSSATPFTVTAPPAEVTFNAIHDARVVSSSPTTSYGAVTELRVRSATADPAYRTYLKFDVNELGGSVQSAKVRLHCINASASGGAIYAVANNYLGTTTPWVESGLTWNNAPTLGATPLSQVGTVANNTWYEFDVTSAVTGTGTYSFGMLSPSADIAGYSSRETAFDPQLVVRINTAPGVVADSAARVMAGVPGYEVHERIGTIALGPAYPNPFRDRATLRLELPQAKEVVLSVYDLQGRIVRKLVDGSLPAGVHEVSWDGRDDGGGPVSSGVYMLRMQTRDLGLTRKLLLVR